MCGIAGYINLTGEANDGVIEAMTNSIPHRGPDGSGVKVFNNVAIGHRRLSIIDLVSGAQPMSGSNGQLWITYNGELYNFLDLKKELTHLGHKFSTSSDTEVIIYAYKQWGESCVKKFRGMFAFGIVDLGKQIVFLARDHFGIKPLYVYTSGNCIAFGSELQQFRYVPNFNNSLNINAIDQYLWLQYIPAPLTVFNSVQKVKPAHSLTVSFTGSVSNQVNYWDVDLSRKDHKSEVEWLDSLDAALDASVKAHLVSDVPFGAFLSGGIDSSLVVGYMHKHLRQPVQTFSIGFNEADYNELPYAEEVAKKFNTVHHTEIIEPNALDILPQMVKHYGEPYGDSSAIPTYYLCRLARKHVTMALSGDGGDECFAGYNSYINWLKFMPIQYRKGLKKKIYPYLEKYLSSKYPKKDTLTEWLANINYIERDWRSKIWKDEFKAQMHLQPEGFEQLFEHTTNFSLANKAQYMDLKTYLPYDILTKVDIASMMNSLEVRTPLVDKEIWELAAAIPEELNINTDSGEWQGKLLLKKLLQKHFDASFVHRKKKGFAVPLTKWFSSEAELAALVNDKIVSQNSVLSNFFDQKNVASLLKSGRVSAIWQLLFLEEWLQLYNGKKHELFV